MFRNKRGILLLGLAALCGLGTIRAANSYLDGQRVESVPVAVAAGPLEMGATLASADFRFAELPAESAPSGALTTPAQLEGRLLRRALVESEPILESALYPVETGAATATASDVPNGPPEQRELFANGNQIVRLFEADAAEDVLRRVEVERGESVVLISDFPVVRVVVGDPEKLEADERNPQTIELRALAAGDTNVLLWDASGRLQAALDIHIAAFHAQAVAEIREILGNDRIDVTMAGGAVVLKGTVDSLEARERAEQVAVAFFAETRDGEARVVNLLDVGGNQQVMIEVTLAEMSRKFSREFGIDFNALITEGGKAFALSSGIGSAVGAASSTLNGSYTSDNVNLDAAVKILREQGLIRILAEPILVARTGQKASFLAGGQLAYPEPTGLGTVGIEYKDFGVGVEFVPTVLGGDLIHLEVAPAVSEPDYSLGTSIEGTRVPGLRTRRASTTVTLRDGQAFAIAGLLSEKTNTVAAENPGLANVPVLGALFRSQEFQQDETELVLIVKPRLVKPLEPGDPPLPTDHYVPPSDSEFYRFGRIEATPAATGGMLGERGHLLPEPVEEGGEG